MTQLYFLGQLACCHLHNVLDPCTKAAEEEGEEKEEDNECERGGDSQMIPGRGGGEEGGGGEGVQLHYALTVRLCRGQRCTGTH